MIHSKWVCLLKMSDSVLHLNICNGSYVWNDKLKFCLIIKLHTATKFQFHTKKWREREIEETHWLCVLHSVYCTSQMKHNFTHTAGELHQFTGVRQRPPQLEKFNLPMKTALSWPKTRDVNNTNKTQDMLVSKVPSDVSFMFLYSFIFFFWDLLDVSSHYHGVLPEHYGNSEL